MNFYQYKTLSLLLLQKLRKNKYIKINNKNLKFYLDIRDFYIKNYEVIKNA